MLRNKLIPMSNTPQDLLWGEHDPVCYQAAQVEKIMKRWVLLVTASLILVTPLIPTMLQNRIHHSLAIVIVLVEPNDYPLVK